MCYGLSVCAHVGLAWACALSPVQVVARDPGGSAVVMQVSAGTPVSMPLMKPMPGASEQGNPEAEVDDDLSPAALPQALAQDTPAQPGPTPPPQAETPEAEAQSPPELAQVEPLPDAPAEPVEQVAEAGDMAESGDPPHPPDLDTQADATPRPSEGDALIHALLEHLLGQASRSGDAASRERTYHPRDGLGQASRSGDAASEADRAELMQAEPTPQVAHAAPAEDTTPSVPAAEPASPDRAELAETSTEAETVSDAPVAENAGRVFDESEVDAPIRFRRQVRPTAPALSRRHNETGSVVVLIRVDAAGVLDDVRVLDDAGHPRLVEAALKALRRSTFAPATRGGEPVTSTRRVEYRF